MIKVLMLGWELPPRITGGLGVACQGLAEGLARSGVDLRFVLPRLFGGEQIEGGRVIAAGLPSEEGQATAAVSWDFFGPYAPGGFRSALATEVARYAAAVAEFAKGEPADVVHAHDWVTFEGGIAARRTCGAQLVVHVHSSEYDRSPVTPDAEIAALEARGLEAADRVVCVSAYTRSVLARHYPLDLDKVRVVHNALTPPGPTATDGRTTPTVLFLGRLTPQKAPERFLEVAARVAEELPEARFVLAGDGVLRGHLEERAVELGLAERTSFPGFLAGPALRALFSEASVLVVPSESEPFGMVVLEAMAHGVPVVMPSDCGAAETVQSALKVDSRDVELLADRTLAVLRRPALARDLAVSAREEVARLTWTRAAERMLQVYSELCG